MSQVVETPPEAVRIGPTPIEPSRSRPSRGKVLVWCLAATAVLLTSGLVRAVQSRRYQEDKSVVIECPFPLKELPRTLGNWHIVPRSETVLDPLTTRITGSTDHMLTSYYDGLTGVTLSVLVLYGPAEPVMPHTPQVCYPSSGFQAVGETVDRSIKISDKETATFRSSVFAKSGGRQVLRNAVYHSFLLDGTWSPAFASRKFARINPGIFNVQIQRRVIDGEKRGDVEPIEDFVQQLLPAIEQKIASASAHQPPTVATR